MAYYKFTLKAGVPMAVPVSGNYILVDDVGAAPGIDIMPNYGGRDLPNMPTRKKAFKFAEPYDGVTLTTTVDATVALFLSKNDVSLGFADGSAVSVSGQVQVTNKIASRVPVDIGGGNVNVTATNVGINNTEASPVPVKAVKLTNLVNIAPVVVGTGAAVQVVSDATLKRIQFRNGSTDKNIGIGGAGVTMATAAIVLEPGDVWIDTDAPGAAWYATADVAGADLRMMGAK